MKTPKCNDHILDKDSHQRKYNLIGNSPSASSRSTTSWESRYSPSSKDDSSSSGQYDKDAMNKVFKKSVKRKKGPSQNEKKSNYSPIICLTTKTNSQQISRNISGNSSSSSSISNNSLMAGKQLLNASR